MNRFCLIALAIFVGYSAGCAPQFSAPPPIPATTIAGSFTPALTPIIAAQNPRITTPLPHQTLPAPAAPVTLTLWTIEEWTSPSTPAGRIWQEQQNAFRTSQPEIALNVALKKPAGKGGLYDFLATTFDIVPARLPDIIMLDFAELAFAADARLIPPLGENLAALPTDLFPFALQGARVKDQTYGVPFSADVQHGIALTAAPRTWDEFLRQKSPLIAPVGGDDAFVLQYLGVGAAFDNDGIDVNAAAQVLDFFKRARDAGLLPDSTLAMKTEDESSSAFFNAQAGLAHISAARFMNERAKLPAARFAALPTRDGRLAARASGWAIAIVTTDPARRRAAARWIEFVMQKDRLSAWMRAAQRVPTTRGALELAIEPPDYSAFLRNLLERASVVHLSPKQADAWRAAMSAVLRGQSTPTDAARIMAQR